jgi:beta-glucosidase-like glycosyl hydrolase
VTAFPASLALAATFDEGLAAEYGTAVAEEARDTGANVLLGPAVDIARAPLGGRLPEALGEDPCLAGRLAAAEVRAIQDGHVIAMVKHFVGNNAETGRTGYATSSGRTPAVNTVVSERALQELYYPPFKAVVQRGRAGSVMGSYNRLNGVYACQHSDILRMLKDEWGWEGFVAPDFRHAVRDPVAAANAGLDIPGLAVTEGRTAEDFTTGAIPAERLDEIVRRILFAIFDAGLDEHPVPDAGRRPALASTPGHVALATRIATDGMVLLRDRDRLLPLDAGQVRSVAVLGTARDDAQWVMAGSPCVRVAPDRRITPLDGIAARAGAGVRVAFAQGVVRRRRSSGRAGRGARCAGWGGDGAAGRVLERRDLRRRAGPDRGRPDRRHPHRPRGADRRRLVGPVDRHHHPGRGRAAPFHRPGRRDQPARDRRQAGRGWRAGVRPGVRRAAAPGQRHGRPPGRPSGQHSARLQQPHRLAGHGPGDRRRERPAGMAAAGHAHPGGSAAGGRL